MWGTLPFGSSLLALLVLFIPDRRRPADEEIDSSAAAENLEPGRLAL
jgi:hypothetical protein